MKIEVKFFFRKEGSYLLFTKSKKFPLFLENEENASSSNNQRFEDVYLLMRTYGVCPTLSISHSLLCNIVNHGLPLKFCVAVNTVTHLRALQALGRKPASPDIWIAIDRNDEQCKTLQSLISMEPDQKYKTRYLIYPWSQELASDLREISKALLNSIEFLVSANCTRRVTVFEVPFDFLDIALLAKGGLSVSVLNERDGAF